MNYAQGVHGTTRDDSDEGHDEGHDIGMYRRDSLLDGKMKSYSPPNTEASGGERVLPYNVSKARTSKSGRLTSTGKRRKVQRACVYCRRR